MEAHQKKILTEKAEDYRRFGFILLSLSIFLFIGLLIPSDDMVSTMPEFIIWAEFVLLATAFVLHRIAIKVEKQLVNEK